MDVSFDIKRMIGKISTKGNDWSKELNIVSWNDAEAKYDIRDWSPDHERINRGITLTADEAMALYKLLKEEFDKTE